MADIDQFLQQNLPAAGSNSSIGDETLKAPARVVGGIAANLGKVAQYATGDRAGGGLRNWGERTQQAAAMTPGFVQAHPAISTLGQVAEGAAEMAPYIALGAVPVVGEAAGALALGAQTGQESYERAKSQGMSSDEALKASYLPAAVGAAGMAAMGTLGKAGRGLFPAARVAEGGVVKSILNPSTALRDIGGAVAVDTPLMVGTNAAISAAQGASGIKPEKTPGEIAKDPKEWLTGALTGGIFGALHAVQRNVAAGKLNYILSNTEVDPAVRRATVDYVGSHLEGDAKENWLSQAHAAVDAGQPIPTSDALLSAALPKAEAQPTPEEAQGSILQAVAESAATGESPMDVLHEQAAAPAEAEIDQGIAEQHDRTQVTAQRFIQQGIVDLERGKPFDPSVAEALDRQGYTALPMEGQTLAGRPRQRWEIISKDEAARRQQEADLAQAQEPTLTQEAGDAETNQEAGGTPAQEEGRPEQAAEPLGVAPADVADAVGRSENDVSAEAVAAPPLTRAEENLRLKDAGFSGRAIKAMSAEDRDAALRQIAVKRGEIQDAQQERSTASPDGGGGAQSEVRTEGGDTAVGREGVRGSGQEAGTAKPLEDGEVRRLTENEALARKGDKVILVMSDPEGKLTKVAEALRNAKGEFTVSAADSESPEAAARMVSALREAGMQVGTKFSLKEGDNAPGSTGVSDDGAKLGDLDRVKLAASQVSGKPIPDGSIRLVQDTDLNRQLSGIGDAFGRKIILFENLKPEELTVPDGFVSKADPTKIYIDKNSQDPHLAVLGHELLHTIEISDPALYEPFVGYLKSELDQEHFERYKQVVPRDSSMPEVAADTVGALLADPKFWADMREQNESLFSRVISYVADLIGRLFADRPSGRFIAQTTASIYKDYDKIRQVTGDLISNLAKTSPKSSEIEGLVFSKKFSGAKTPQESAETSNDLSQRSLTTKDFSRLAEKFASSVYRALMAIDRTIDIAKKSAWARPISGRLNDIQNIRRDLQQYAKVQAEDAVQHTNAFRKVFRTADDLKKAADVVYKATLYQLDPWRSLDRQWAGGKAGEKVWTPVDNAEFAPAQTIDEAKADLRQAFAKLTEPQRQALDSLTSQVDRAHQDLIAATIEHLKGMYGEGERFDKAKAAVESQARLEGRYFPLRRFGDYMVRSFDTPGGKLLRAESFETQGAAIRAAEAAKKAGLHATLDTAMRADNSHVNVPAGLIADIEAAAEARGIAGDQLEGLKSDLQRLWVNTLPQNHVAGSKLERSGVAGFNTDVLRTFADYVNKNAQATARAKYGWQIADKYKEIRQTISKLQEGSHDPEAIAKMQGITNYLESQDQQQHHDKIALPVRFFNRLAFMTMLTSPTMWIAHMAQPLMFTVPKLAAKFGVKALEAHYRFTKNWLSGKYSDAKLSAWDEANGGLGRQAVEMMEKVRSLDAKIRGGGEAAADFGDAREAQKTLTSDLQKERDQIAGDLQKLYEGLDQTGKEYLVLRAGAMMGATELSGPYDLHDLAMGAGKLDEISNNLTNTAGFFLRKGVSGARKAAATATFDLAYKDPRFAKDFTKVFDYMTRDIVDDTLYNYDPNNKPGWMKTNTGRLTTQFQFFRFQTIGKIIQLSMDAAGKGYKDQLAAAEAERVQHEQIFGKEEANKAYQQEVTRLQTERSEARRELAYMTASSMALAGAAGAPLTMLMANTATEAIYNAIAWMFEDPDDPWTFGHDLSQGLHNAVGDDLANVLEKGLPSLIGMDLSHRLGVGGAMHIVEGEPPEGLTAGERSAWYANKLLGPAWSMVGDWRKAMDAVAAGNAGDAVKYSSPNFVRNFFKAYDLDQQGVQVAGKTVKQPEEVSMYDIALQLSGINPMDVSLAKEESQYLKNVSVELSQRRRGLITGLAKATVAGDQDGKEAAIEKINSWSEKNPALKISSQELASAVKRLKNNQAGVETKREKVIKGMVEGA